MIYMDNTLDVPIKKPNRLLFYSICGMIPMLLFAVWLIIAAIISPGYNGNGDYISPVTGGYYSMIQNIVFVVLGLLSIGLASGLRIGLPSPRNVMLKLGVLAVSIFGLGVFLGGFLPLIGLLPENYLVIVPYNLLTSIGFAVTIIAYIAAVLLMGLGLKYENSTIWGGYSRFSLITGVLFILLQGLIIITIFYKIYPGVSQRIIIIILWVWILVTGFKLYSVSRQKKADTV